MINSLSFNLFSVSSRIKILILTMQNLFKIWQLCYGCPYPFFTRIYVPLFYMSQVEKHKILQVGNGKTGALANEGHEVIETGTHNIPLANTNYATAVDMKTNENQVNVVSRKLNANPTIVSSNLNTDKSSSATDSGKPLNMGNMKKPSRSSSSFFDRWFFLSYL